MKKVISTCIFLAFILLLPVVALASSMVCNATGNHCARISVRAIMILDDGQVMLKVDGEVPNSCSYFGYVLQFAPEQTMGAASPMYAAFLTFLSQRRKMNFQMDIAAPEVRGTDQTNGCTRNSPSKIRNIRVMFDPAEFTVTGELESVDDVLVQ